MSLTANDVSWSAGGTLILDGVGLRVDEGRTVGLLGPNGSGKSSLLRLLAGLRRPSSGAIEIGGRAAPQWSRRDLARRVAVVEQQVGTDVDLTVTEVVALGRTPHRNGWGGANPDDAEIIRRVLAQTGLDGLADRRWHSLSGGERQRAQIARALAQEPAELILDEPTNHLDIAHQLELLALVRRLPVTSVIALHDLNLAGMFCDELAVLSGGRVVATGTPAEVLTEQLVADVYGVRCSVSAVDGRPHVRFLVD
ncbi:ABC transporter ATP-binding protein [Saccharopolyspora sp. NFXS83]|uniref:ABC transporter ATP-binding protein n=1 Tax=Saccharopolyspora sp. NFXS83 TaxID=2993560 RepID=UPI00224B4BFB|nr:ABC transporter ATP-binding protein [Saccharopolyspora sp. NFXS83]MCX2730153.1 ABC transporter ATP-binding protein [Saccharopolyspora sp. NFXS83]